jgi:23S rRNA (uracil1939-C5)-methyltransferase
MEDRVKKNDEVKVLIEDMSESGEGIGHFDGLTLFVKDAVIGDLVLCGITKVKKTYCYARTIEILTPSAYRTEPVCPIYRPCGGCQLQALSYEKQLDFKTEKVAGCFKRIGGFEVEVEAISDEKSKVLVKRTIGMEPPWNYRNKAQFPIGLDKSGNPTAGFYARRTHNVIPTKSCAIEFEGHEAILEAVLNYIKQSGETVGSSRYQWKKAA